MTNKNKKVSQKVSLVTGLKGQDGSYLAEFFLSKKYKVHEIKRRANSFNNLRIDHLYQDPHLIYPNFSIHYGDFTDSLKLTNIIQGILLDEIYNLGTQSNVPVSLETPENTANGYQIRSD